MIRQPTNSRDAYSWWRDALAGRPVEYLDGYPQPGFFKTRLCKGGPWVPCRIWLCSPVDANRELTAPEFVKCEVNQREVRSPDNWWLSLAKNPISQFEFHEMIKLIEWAGSNDPSNPVLNPRQPIDLTRRVSCPTTQ